MIEDTANEQFLQPFDPVLRQTALRLREIVLSTMPGIIEQVDTPAKLIGYGTDRTYRGTICAIALHKKHINLMFARGTELSDPASMLEGTGKKARHVKIIPGEPMNEVAINTLLRAALALHGKD